MIQDPGTSELNSVGSKETHSPRVLYSPKLHSNGYTSISKTYQVRSGALSDGCASEEEQDTQR